MSGWPTGPATPALRWHLDDGEWVVVGGEALAIDWPHAARGAAFCDLIGWLPSLRMEGGLDPEQMLRSTAVGRAADPEAVTTYAVALAGFFVHESLLPDPPGIPHVSRSMT